MMSNKQFEKLLQFMIEERRFEILKLREEIEDLKQELRNNLKGGEKQ